MNTRYLFRSLAVLTSLCTVGAFAAQGGQDAIANNTPGFINKATNQGPLDPTSILQVNVWLKLHNQAQLDALVEGQKQKNSASYQHWITQDQFNATYAPTAQEVKAISNLLAAHNLSVLSVADNNLYVKAQGSVADIQKTFHVQLNQYGLNGVSYRSNAADPSVDKGTNGLIAAVTGLDDYGFQPKFVRPTTAEGTPAPMQPVAGPSGLFFASQCFRAPQTQTFTAGTTTATYTGNRYGTDITNTTLGSLPPCGY
ncbi:protease pro-enzyme activation domain-containing protein, partial [Rudaea sp.]|uniref:protease pro-enzyme activation domain-containing protein n=1 Tax=Rudaea sp. TaxID=2136325 RepID=UPI002ED20A03